MASVHPHGGDQLGRLANHIITAVARTAQKCLIHINDFEVGVGDDNAFGVLLHGAVKLAQLLLTSLQRGQHLHAFLNTAPQTAAGHQRGHDRQPQHAQHIEQRYKREAVRAGLIKVI